MSVDYRREWIKQQVVSYLGLPSGDYFEDMLSANDGELEFLLDAFLDEDVIAQNESHKRFFYVYRTTYEKLVDEEIMVPEIGTCLSSSIQSNISKIFDVSIVEKPPPSPVEEVTEVKRKKKKRKGSGNKKKKKKGGGASPSSEENKTESGKYSIGYISTCIFTTDELYTVEYESTDREASPIESEFVTQDSPTLEDDNELSRSAPLVTIDDPTAEVPTSNEPVNETPDLSKEVTNEGTALILLQFLKCMNECLFF